MLAVLFHGERELELRTIDDPVPSANQVVIAVQASGMCGSDLHEIGRASCRERVL